MSEQDWTCAAEEEEETDAAEEGEETDLCGGRRRRLSPVRRMKTKNQTCAAAVAEGALRRRSVGEEAGESQSVGTVSLVTKRMLLKSVMRSSLPDLFEAQPDLLFQLVTMLNPSVLQEKGVPVYSIIQEPGNFVITFPRSYHGGFNFGLNCAEAVNFAPADWLPHGGFGAELYRHYHKVPVLSHEELLCVVAKSELDNRVSSYLRKELLRIYNNEKTWREKLWRYGIKRTSTMTPRMKSDYVGTEEDPTCVICQQLLYLSAVSCNCRPSTYVCLEGSREHWGHLCECKPDKLRLSYRQTLAELSELLLKVDKYYSVEAAADSQKDTSSEKAVVLTKKVKGDHVTHLQLAQEWILRSSQILEHPYSRNAYVSAIEEAEQFLWAGSDMDLVREMQNDLIQAQNWEKAVRDCFSEVKLRSNSGDCVTQKVLMDDVNKLLRLRSTPCTEPDYLQLKEYQEEANKLIQEINSALTSCSEYSVADLEILYAKTVDSPIHVKESEELKLKLSAVKVWLDDVGNCISQKAPSSVEVDMLYKLESEIVELQFQLPEAALITDLTRQAKSCQSRCNEILKDLVGLKEVKLFLSEWEDFHVKIPELELLKQYCKNTLSWTSRVDSVLMNVHLREDQEKVVDELTCILRDGLLLKIQVNELPRVELELEKARCRVKAFKGSSVSNVHGFHSATSVGGSHIEKEQIFTDLSQRHAAAICWDEKAKHLVATKAHMSDFEDLLRACEHIHIIPSSLFDVKLAVSTARAWLTKSKPFLHQDSSVLLASDTCLRVDDLKELVLESEDINVHLEEFSLLEKVLKKSLEWEQDASTLLQNAEHLWNTGIEGILNFLIPRLEYQVLLMETAIKSGISLGLEFNMIPKLQDACATFKWCITALSFSTTFPTRKDVEMILSAAASLPVINKSAALWTALVEGLSWLKKSLEILAPNSHGKYQVSSVEEVIVLSKKTCISFPLIIGRLHDAVNDHKSAYIKLVKAAFTILGLWREQVQVFFGLSFEDRSWNTLIELKEHGKLNNTIERSFEVFHVQCAETSSEDAVFMVCKYCDFISTSKLPRSGCGPLRTGRKHLSLDKLTVLLADSNDLCLWIDERRILHQVVEKAIACNACLTELVNFALAHSSNDLHVVTQKICIALKAMDAAGITDHEGSRKFELALARTSWKIRAVKLLESAEKPTLQQIQIHLKEGLGLNIPPEDYFTQKLTELRNIALQWAETAKKVSVDGGVLGLDKVFELIWEGESLPVSCEKELKLLRDRSMLYCICRRPYDRRAMIACDKCDEWYHFDCIKISSAPKIYICPACDPRPRETMSSSAPTIVERSNGNNFEEPQTPLRCSELKRNSKTSKPVSKNEETHEEIDLHDCLTKFSSNGKLLLWRNRKPFRRAARKRSQFQSLSPFFHVHNK
ncbi:hypothetical protein OROHE_009619 [Orobanche hederae]